MSNPTLTVAGYTFGSGPLWVLSWPDMDGSQQVRVSDLSVPFGADVYRRAWPAGAMLEFEVGVDHEQLVGAVAGSDGHEQVAANLRAVRAALLRHDTVTTATWTKDGTAWEADVHASLSGVHVGPLFWRGWLQLTVPAGVWRKSTATSVSSALSSATRTVTVPNAGAMQFGLRLSLSGTASSVTFSNESWDGVWLTFGGALTGGVEIDCAEWTAVRDGLDVPGLVTYSGHERWLPLRPGDNAVEIAPTGGNVAVTFAHNEVW